MKRALLGQTSQAVAPSPAPPRLIQVAWPPSLCVAPCCRGFVTAVVPKTQSVWLGINHAKDILKCCIFHKRCSEPVRVDGFEYMSGVDALENYQSGRLGANGVERVMPLHDLTSHGADAFRTFAEAYTMGWVSKESSQKRYDPRTGDVFDDWGEESNATSDGVPEFWNS